MPIHEDPLERAGKVLWHPVRRFYLISLVLLVPGIVLLVIDNSWSLPFGIALVLLGCLPVAVGTALLLSGTVARWAARHKLFA